MSTKNFMGRALRTGLLATAAATMLMGNMAAFAAEDDEAMAFFWQEDAISGTVTEVGADSITVRVSGAMEEGGFGMGMPQDGQTPPELPDGQTPPERPEGEGPEFTEGEMPEPPEGGLFDGQTPPERPEGEGAEFAEGERPEPPEGEPPEGMEGLMGQPQDGQGPQGGMPFMGGQFSSEVTVNIDSGTAIIKADGENGTISDISEGSDVMVMLNSDVALSILVMN